MNAQNTRLIINWIGVSLIMATIAMAVEAFRDGNTSQGIQNVATAALASLATAWNPMNRNPQEQEANDGLPTPPFPKNQNDGDDALILEGAPA